MLLPLKAPRRRPRMLPKARSASRAMAAMLFLVCLSRVCETTRNDIQLLRP